MKLRDRIITKNGLTFSVQASSGHYCTPRSNNGPYTHVEVGFPNKVIERLIPFAENPDNLTETVYGWVPVELIKTIIIENGGIDFEKMGVEIDTKKFIK